MTSDGGQGGLCLVLRKVVCKLANVGRGGLAVYTLTPEAMGCTILRLRDVMALHPISVIVLWSLIS